MKDKIINRIRNIRWKILIKYTAIMTILQILYHILTVYCGWNMYVEHYSLHEVLAVITAVFIEEFIFRYLIIRRLFHFTHSGVIAGSVLFAIFHTKIEAIIFYFAAGMILGYSYMESEDISIPVILHLINNIVAILL